MRSLNQAKICNVYSPGQVIFYQGNPCLGIHCIESGTVALRKTDAAGNAIVARLFHAGDTLGYLAYFAQRGYTGTAEALTEARICFIDRAAARALLSRNPGLSLGFLGRIAENLREAEEGRLAAAHLSVRERLARLLLALKDRLAVAGDDGSLVMELPLSRADLASMVGARPESVSRVLSQLDRDGVARFSGRTVTIPDLDLLLDELADEV